MGLLRNKYAISTDKLPSSKKSLVICDAGPCAAFRLDVLKKKKKHYSLIYGPFSEGRDRS